jgi:hypothetical protein
LAHLWAADGEGGWQAAALAGDAFVLTGAGPEPAPSPPEAGADLRLLRLEVGDGTESWALLGGPEQEALVNGLPIAGLGIRVLRDRDQVQLPGGPPFFFSSERLAQVESFPGAAGARCPRCQAAIGPATPAVRCPGCGLWHHQSPEWECWTYGHCSGCGRAGALGGDFAWTPEGL